jgi:hypothetical protein
VASSQTALLALNPVLAERADDFEQWLRNVLVPAATAHRPHLRGAWEVLRATGPEDGVVVFAFLLRGGEERDWDLVPLFEEALGAEGAQRALQEMQEMMRGEQYGWSLRPVEFE